MTVGLAVLSGEMVRHTCRQELCRHDHRESSLRLQEAACVHK